jgi:hypothetical protein
MKRVLALAVCAALVNACAAKPNDEDGFQSIDDPKFVSWYKAAPPYARTAFFITLCAAQGFSNGSIEINFCVSNLRRDAHFRVEGRL